MNLRMKFILFSLLLISVSCDNTIKENDNFKRKDRIIRKDVILEDSTTISYLYDTLGNIVSSLKKNRNGQRVGVQKVYYQGTNILKYKVFYKNGKKNKVIAYDKKGAIIEEKKYN